MILTTSPKVGIAVRLVVLVVTLGALFACGGGGGDGGSTASTQPAQPTVDSFVTSLNASMGEENAFNGVTLAYANGYSLAQIVEAGMAGRLGADGIIARLAATARANQLATTLDLNALRMWLTYQSENTEVTGGALGALVLLMATGYSADQIVEAFLFGYSIRLAESGTGIYVIDETGNLVAPSRAADTTTFADAGSTSDDTPSGGTDTDSGGVIASNAASALPGRWSLQLGDPTGALASTMWDCTFAVSGITFTGDCTLTGNVMLGWSFTGQILANNVVTGQTISTYNGTETSSGTFQFTVAGPDALHGSHSYMNGVIDGTKYAN